MTKRLKSVYLKITIYYIVAIGGLVSVFTYFPGFVDYFPVGTTEKLFSSTQSFELQSTVHAGRLEGESELAHGLFFVMCFLSSILLTIPLGCTYLGTHNPEKSNPSFAKSIILLPIAVTGLVLIVQNSLALAFGLAGIVAGAGIRFRTNMKEFTDTLFFLTSIGIGLSAGVGALGLSLIMSLIFCYTILTLYAINYGETAPASEVESVAAIPNSDRNDETAPLA